MKTFLLLWPALFLACSCLMPEEEGAARPPLRLMTWNVQNLFDGVSDGGEYEEYDPEISEWDETGMRIRMEGIQELLYSLEDGLPDILLFQEVENRAVLETLNDEYLEGHYAFVDAWKDRESAICCGVLSVLTPEAVHLHFPGKYGKRELRPLAELHFQAEGETLVVFNNHWKSRSGGAAATEDARIRAASLLSFRIRELREEGIRTIIAAGDLNGSEEDYRSGGRQTAQMPAEEAGAASWADGLFVCGDKADFSLSDEKTILWSPWDAMEREGSYFYQNRWMKLDHFLLDSGFFDGAGAEFVSCVCYVPPFLLDDEGKPRAWESWRREGYSDHFPLLLELAWPEGDSF